MAAHMAADVAASAAVATGRTAPLEFAAIQWTTPQSERIFRRGRDAAAKAAARAAKTLVRRN